MTRPRNDAEAPPVAPGGEPVHIQASPPAARAAPACAPLVRHRRGQARGNTPSDWDREPVLLRRSGRERGGKVYLSAETLRRAFAAAGMDPEPPFAELEVWRTVLGGHKNEAQVLLKIRRRKGASP